MRLTVPFWDIDEIDISDLYKGIEGLDQEKWDEWSLRQTKFRPHKKTNSIPFIWNTWDPLTKSMNLEYMNQDINLWKLLIPVLDKLKKKYEGIVVNCLLAKLPSKERIIPHKDSGIHLLLTNRIHLPIKTNPNVKFYIEGKAYEFAAGRCFELSNEKQHSVQNLSNEDRVHLIVDILPKYFRQFLNNPQN